MGKWITGNKTRVLKGDDMYKDLKDKLYDISIDLKNEHAPKCAEAIMEAYRIIEDYEVIKKDYEILKYYKEISKGCLGCVHLGDTKYKCKNCARFGHIDYYMGRYNTSI